MFKRLLIANRGEIACRIIRTAKRLGIYCIAIYSEADANSLHIKMADEAHCVGAATAAKSYLAIDKIIAIAQLSHADAIHPGYGFLSENANFALACEQAGICFIGPNADAIRIMGSKDLAKQTVARAGVPIVPTYFSENNSDEALSHFIAAASNIGYPVILKAVAGGGGKGMRLINNQSEFDAAWSAARREAQKSFANNAMMLEKYISPARHIEIQLFGDKQKNYVYLFERDCSLQRRHQKILEEALAPHVSTALRQALGETAIKAAQAVDYVNAGTIEFLVDKNQQFYFMEMNTRLQVEHVVTEMITGQDLVEWQLRIAANERLPLQQSQIKSHGHAIEARIYAEDPAKNFLPCTGTIRYMQLPETDSHTQIHTNLQLNDKIDIHYDPLLAKLIVWGKDRKVAILQLLNHLNQLQLAGVTTNIDFLKTLIQHPAYQAGNVDTHFIANHEEELLPPPSISKEMIALASCFILLKQTESAMQNNEKNSPWLAMDNWRLNAIEPQQLKFLNEGQPITVAVTKTQAGYELGIQDNVLAVSAHLAEPHLTLSYSGQTLTATIIPFDDKLDIFLPDQHVQLGLPTHSIHHIQNEQANHQVISPMPGTVVAVYVQSGQAVKKGEKLMAIEAMKMEHTLLAPSDGTIKEIFHTLGTRVEEGQKLLQFDR